MCADCANKVVSSAGGIDGFSAWPWEIMGGVVQQVPSDSVTASRDQ